MYIIVSFLVRNCDIIVQSAFALVLSMSFAWLNPGYIFNCRRKLWRKRFERRKSVIRLKEYTNRVLSQCNDKFSLRIWEFASKPSSRRKKTTN